MVEIGEENVQPAAQLPGHTATNAGGRAEGEQRVEEEDEEEKERTLQPEDMLPEGRYAEYTFPPSQLSSYLLPSTPPLTSTSASSSSSPPPAATASSLWSNKVMWLDVIGLHTPTLSFLSNHFSLPASVFDPALIALDSVARCEFDHDELHEQGVLSVLLHAVSIDRLPYRKKTRREREKARRRSAESQPQHSHLYDDYTLLADREYRSHRPCLTSLPIHLIVVGAHTVITIHPLTSSPPLDDIFSEFRSLLSQSIVHSLPFSSSPSAMVGMRMSTARTLAVELMDEVTDWNWSLRDVLKQWKVLLSDTLTAGYVDKGLLEHIHDLENVSLRAGRLLSPQARMLSEMVGDEGDRSLSQQQTRPPPSAAAAAAASDNADKSSAASDATGLHLSAPASNSLAATSSAGTKPHSLRRDGSKSSFTSSSSDSLLSASGSTRNIQTMRLQRALFLSDIELDLRNLSKSISRLNDQLRLTNDLSLPLLSYYKQRKDEETNKILSAHTHPALCRSRSRSSTLRL